MNTRTNISLPRHIMNLLASLSIISFFSTTLYGVIVHGSSRFCFYLRLYREWLKVSKLGS